MSMSTPTVPEYQSILQTVHNWPLAQRITLAQDVLKDVSTEVAAQRPRRPTLDQALGLLATTYPAPSDAEIKQWLTEHRTEKYG
jgi:hypothetical protein